MSRTFNGTTDKGIISSALLSSLAAGAMFHIAIWAKTSNTTALGMVFGVTSSASNNPMIALGFDGTTTPDKAYAYVRDGVPSAGSPFYPSNAYSANTWHHLTLRNLSTAARNANLDAVFASATANFDSMAGTFSPNRTAVGVLSRTTESAFLAGKIARIAIWRGTATTDLPDSDDQVMLNLGADAAAIKPSTLVYLWDNDLGAVVGGQSFTFTGTTVDSADNPPADSRPLVVNSVSSWEVPAGGGFGAGFTNTGLGYNAAAGELLIGDFTNGRIVRADTTGAYIGAVTLSGAPATTVQGIAWDASRGHYWVNHYSATAGGGTIRRYNASGVLQQTITTSGVAFGPNGLAYDAVNDRLITSWGEGKVLEYTAAGALYSTVNLEFAPAADGIALDPVTSNWLWITCEVTGTGDKIKKFNRTTGAVLWSYTCPDDPETMTFVGDELWMCCDQGFHSSVPNGNRVHRTDITYYVPGPAVTPANCSQANASSTTTVSISGGGGEPPAPPPVTTSTVRRLTLRELLRGVA